MSSEIYVCQVGTCRRNGSEAVLLEIEELVTDEHCKVEGSGCLGLCNRAPNAVVLKEGRREEKAFTRLNSLEKTIEVVKHATGKVPILSDPEVQSRLKGVRAFRARENAMSLYRWNGALKATQDQINSHSGGNNNRTLQNAINAYRSIFTMAGFNEELMENKNNNNHRVHINMPSKIEKYSQWKLQKITVISKHTAIFHFVSNDRKRGTPHPRGGGRGPPTPKTWHTTMLAEVGFNEEGPLPWIERDYTPISSAKEWEQGKCDILIKIYNDGAATSWLHKHTIMNQSNDETTPPPPSVWFSQPVQTLSVPGLVHCELNTFFPASVLLVLAGTGVVALPQILHHRDPIRKLGISSPRRNQLHVPINVILSCRKDDILMLPEIITLCQESSNQSSNDNNNNTGANTNNNNNNRRRKQEKGIKHCTLLLTEKNKEIEKYPFTPSEDISSKKSEEDNMINILNNLPNGQVLESRLEQQIVTESLSRMPQPCRIVVSGPSGFNAAARGMLIAAGVSHDNITILEA